MCSLCRLPVAKNHNFGQILTFLGHLYRPSFTDDDHIWCAIADHGIRLHAKFRLDRCILSPSGGENPQFLPYFRLQHLVVSPIGSNPRKLSTSAQVQTFPYPTVSKSFLYSNDFMAKSGGQTLTFKSVTDRQTDKQTDRQKIQRFGCPCGG